MNCLDESNPLTNPPEPDNLDRLERRPIEGVTFLCYLSRQDLVAMRTTADVDGEPDGPSFRSPDGVVCCCVSVTHTVKIAHRWTTGR